MRHGRLATCAGNANAGNARNLGEEVGTHPDRDSMCVRLGDL